MAVFRVRTRPKALRAVGGSFFFFFSFIFINWRVLSYIGIAREKINPPEHTTGCSKNKGTEKLQRSASLRWTGSFLPEVGGRGEGKGANSAAEKPRPPTLQTGLQFLSKDSLRFWMVDIHGREGRG